MPSLHQSTRYYIAGKALNLLLAPLALILLPGLMGDKGYGHFGYWFSLISLYLVLLDFGSQAMLRRYLPELMMQQQGAAKTLFIKSQQLKILPLTLLLIACLFNNQPWVQISLLVAALSAALLTSIADALYAAQYMGWHSLCQLSRRVLRLIMVPAGFLLWGVEGLLLGLVLAEVVPLLFWFVGRKIFSDQSMSLEKPFWSYYQVGLIGFVGFFVSTFTGRFPVLSAQWAGFSIEQVGHIALCVDLTWFALRELISSISESILPRMIQLKAGKQNEQLHSLLSMNYRFVNLAGMYILALGIPLAPAFLLMLGDSFYHINTALQWMLLVALLGALNSVHNQVLFINEASPKIMYAQLAGLISLIIAFGGLYHIGISALGLCLILVIAMTATCVCSFLFCTSFVGSTASLRYFIRLCAAAILCFAILWVWQPRGILMSLLAGISGSVLFGILVIMFKGLTDKDLSIIRKTLQRQS